MPSASETVRKPIVIFVHVQDVLSKKEKVQQQQRAEELEIGIANQREPERTIAAHRADLPPDFAGEIGVKPFRRIGRRNARDAEAGAETRTPPGP